MPENQITNNFIYLTSSNFVTISHINYWDLLNSCKNFSKFWNGLPCRNKSVPFPLLNVAVYWQSSNTKACAKKLSLILADNIDNGERGTGLRTYVRYCRFSISASTVLFFGTNFQKKYTSSRKHKKWLSLLKSSYSN